MDIVKLLKCFRAYEKVCMGDCNDRLEWRLEFFDFVLWLMETGGPVESRLTSVPADAEQRETLSDDAPRAAEPVS